MTLYQCIKFLFSSLLYFQRYAPNKLFSAKIKKGSNSVNTGDMVMVLTLCDSRGPLLGFIKLPSIRLEICSKQKYDRQMDGRTRRRLHALPILIDSFWPGLG